MVALLVLLSSARSGGLRRNDEQLIETPTSVPCTNIGGLWGHESIPLLLRSFGCC